MRSFLLYILAPFLLSLSSCSDPYFKNDYKDNSPTSGKLKVYYDEGLFLHVSNQARTFESQYPNARIEEIMSTENEAIQALYNDSCEAIVINRMLSGDEMKTFASKKYIPKYSAVAVSGVAVISSTACCINRITLTELRALISEKNELMDSMKKPCRIKILFDKKNSSVMHYLHDSVLKGGDFSGNCRVMNNSKECLDSVMNSSNTLALIDFSWISDRDDPFYKTFGGQFRILPVANNTAGKMDTLEYAYPDQSNFKLGKYPMSRTIYVIRKVGDFTLAKGFESFVAGPKGQTIFLKQGLLPTKQQERSVQVKFVPMNVN